MEPQNPLSKRIKRHVIGRVRDFFAATSPGLEKLCFDELMSLPLSVRCAMVVPGGVEFKGRVHDCYLANLNLRTASRILMRIGVFNADSFNDLEKKLADFPWELFLCPGSLPLISGLGLGEDMASFLPRISVTTRHSRLYHKDAIAERFQASISKRLSQTDFHQEMTFLSDAESENGQHDCKQQIFVRVVDDRFTVSIDSSGDILYKRGLKKQGGSAPIRETAAAAALKLAGYNGNEPLVDPLCGSGTFSFEAAQMAMHMPAGWLREFAFMGWPSFRSQRWAHIRREAEEGLVQIGTPLIFASDKDRKACDALEKRVNASGLSEIIKVSCRDFFDFSPSELTKEKGVVVLNPPYGLRIGTKQESEDIFYAISDQLEKDYKGWRIALVAPDRRLVRTVPFELERHHFCYAGLKLTLLTGKIV